MLLLTVNKPDIIVMLSNMALAFDYLLKFLRYALVFLSLVWVFYALLNLYALASASSGVPNKFFPTQAQPTTAGAFAQLFVAGLLFTFAWNLLPMAIMSSSVMDSIAGVKVYSLGSYDTTNPNSDMVRKLSYDLLIKVMQFIGFMGMFKGIRLWYQVSQGTNNEPSWKIMGYLFWGMVAFNFEWFYSLLTSIMGFDFLGLFMH